MFYLLLLSILTAGFRQLNGKQSELRNLAEKKKKESKNQN